MANNIFEDKKYLLCIKLAKLSKGNERYGSILIKNNQIIGQGFNRAIAHPSFKLERIIRQGMANHAEIEAMNNALVHGHNIEGSDIYVAGYFPKEGKLFLKKDYTCLRCPPYMSKYGINMIYVPMPSGWIGKPLDKAKVEAKKFSNGTHQKRIIACKGNYNIEDLIKNS